MSPYVVMRKRIAFLFLCVGFFLLVLVIRLAYVQLGQGAGLSKIGF